MRHAFSGNRVLSTPQPFTLSVRALDPRILDRMHELPARNTSPVKLTLPLSVSASRFDSQRGGLHVPGDLTATKETQL